MADLTGDAFVKALQSETVTLKIGPHNEEIIVSKALLAYKSEAFAKLLSKPGLTELHLPHVGVAVSKMFVCWCYQERLQNLEVPGFEARKQWKLLMVDLWLFVDDYGIPKLQNQVMKQLTSIHIFGAPLMVTAEDINYIWTRVSSGNLGPLKDLLTLTLVAQLEMPQTVGSTPKLIDQYSELAALPGFMVGLYKALSFWRDFEPPAKQKGKKWALILQSEKVRAALKVEEKAPSADVAAGFGMNLGTPKPAPRPFAPGEVIEID